MVSFVLIRAEKPFVVLVFGEKFLAGGHAEGVDFGSGHGRNVFETGGVVSCAAQAMTPLNAGIG